MSVNTTEMVQKFVAGLHQSIRRELSLFRVTTITDASTTAMAIEDKNIKPATRDNSKDNSSKPTKFFAKKDYKTTNGASKSDIYCAHCKTTGHNIERCWNAHPELKPKRFKDNGKGKLIATVVNQHLGQPERIESMQEPDPKLSLMTGQESPDPVEELFTLNVQVKTELVHAIIDPGSQKNLISASLVERLGLETTPHPNPYPLGWIVKSVGQQVQQQCKVKFAITSRFIDEIICDVVPLDVCHLVLGSPYLWLRDGHYHRRAQEYELTKDDQKFVISRSSVNSRVEIATVGQIKHMFHSQQQFILMFIRKVDLEPMPSAHCLITNTQQFWRKMLEEYWELFEEPMGLPPEHMVEHEIQFQPESKLQNLPLYRYSVMENEEIKRQVADLLEKKVLRLSTSQCASPIVLVPKKDGGWRMCVDYRAINKITIKNRYPLPRIDDLLDQLKHARYFSKLDLKSGYHQVRVKDEDTWKTTFKTRQGLYEWRVMPFGLCNAPATFMRLMNEVLRPFLEDFVLVYLDDILIYSRTWEEHEPHVRQVLHALHQHGLRLNRKKCEFGMESLIYLGFIVGHGELRIDLEKVRVIREWPTPRNVTEVRSFVGACQYLRKFIRHFSILAAPLHDLTKAYNKFEWNEKCITTFELLKKKITEAPVLAFPNLQRTFELETDASNYLLF